MFVKILPYRWINVEQIREIKINEHAENYEIYIVYLNGEQSRIKTFKSLNEANTFVEILIRHFDNGKNDAFDSRIETIEAKLKDVEDALYFRPPPHEIDSFIGMGYRQSRDAFQKHMRRESS